MRSGEDRTTGSSEQSTSSTSHSDLRSKPPGYVHFVAGGLGGMCGATVTAPFDLVKTRLQSSVYPQRVAESPKLYASKAMSTRMFYHFVDTARMIRDIHKNESFRALFRGLGPTLVGTMPARAINFYVYGTGKEIYTRLLGRSDDPNDQSTLVHVCSAITAGIATATVTNPIWVVKTRLQLDQSSSNPPKLSYPSTSIPVVSRNDIFSKTCKSLPTNPQNFNHRSQSFSSSGSLGDSIRCIIKIFQGEGLVGFYRGLSASYLGVAEGTIQWVLYEKLKRWGMRIDENDPRIRQETWVSQIFAAGTAKLMATSITYPHEVIRTRLRQKPPPFPLKSKYTGLITTFKVILAEEGVKAFYGGLSPHLMRVVPNAVVMYTVYETALSLYRQ
ncbi:internal membrane protein [Phakopsora pachyrhizi]|nr:internal membrane protein [Phakopsora pachyrhizi]